MEPIIDVNVQVISYNNIIAPELFMVSGFKQ